MAAAAVPLMGDSKAVDVSKFAASAGVSSLQIREFGIELRRYFLGHTISSRFPVFVAFPTKAEFDASTHSGKYLDVPVHILEKVKTQENPVRIAAVAWIIHPPTLVPFSVADASTIGSGASWANAKTRDAMQAFSDPCHHADYVESFRAAFPAKSGGALTLAASMQMLAAAETFVDVACSACQSFPNDSSFAYSLAACCFLVFVSSEMDAATADLLSSYKEATDFARGEDQRNDADSHLNAAEVLAGMLPIRRAVKKEHAAAMRAEAAKKKAEEAKQRAEEKRRNDEKKKAERDKEKEQKAQEKARKAKEAADEKARAQAKRDAKAGDKRGRSSTGDSKAKGKNKDKGGSSASGSAEDNNESTDGAPLSGVPYVISDHAHWKRIFLGAMYAFKGAYPAVADWGRRSREVGGLIPRRVSKITDTRRRDILALKYDWIRDNTTSCAVAFCASVAQSDSKKLLSVLSFTVDEKDVEITGDRTVAIPIPTKATWDDVITLGGKFPDREELWVSALAAMDLLLNPFLPSPGTGAPSSP